MRELIAPAALAFFIASMAGCRCTSGNKAVLADPLLVSRKPVEAETVAGGPVLVASSEPLMPAHPNGPAYVAKPMPRTYIGTPQDDNRR